MKVLITRRISDDAVSLLEQHFEVDYIKKNQPSGNDFLQENISKYDACLTTITEKMTAELMEKSGGKLKVISNMAIGLDNIDLDAAKKYDIKVFNTPDVVTDSTADMAVGLGLAAIRQIPQSQAYIEQNKWQSWDPEIFCGRTLNRIKWGLVGYGRVGKAVAKRLKAFGTELFHYDPYVDVCSENNSKSVALNYIFKEMDVISVHVPYNEKTDKLIDKEAFSMMQKQPVFLNVARGKVVDNKALIDALKTNQISFAALDVFDPEPLPGNHEIFDFENVIVTPHIGTATVECRRDMAVNAAENIINYFKNL